MGTPLHVLIVEDSEDDTLLLVRALRRDGYDPTFERVETPATMSAALDQQTWDLIISDYTMPHFSAPAALTLLKESGLDLPFIIVSGAIGEETAVEAMKAGAHDYIQKGNLARLIPAIERELRDAQVRRERKQAEEALRESGEKYRALFEQSADAIYVTTREGQFVDLNQAGLDLFGFTREELTAVNTRDLYVHPVDRSRFQQEIEQQGFVRDFEVKLRKKDGTKMDCLLTSTVQRAGDGSILGYQGIIHDLTERKRLEEQMRQQDQT
jgi:PAS domain S-box-containing protein